MVVWLLLVFISTIDFSLGNPCPPAIDISQIDHCNAFEISENTLDRFVKCRCWYGDLQLKGRFPENKDFLQGNTPILSQIFGSLILNRTRLTSLPFPEFREADGMEITSNRYLKSLGHEFKIKGPINISEAPKLCHPNRFIWKLRGRGNVNDNKQFCADNCLGGIVTIDFLNDLPTKCLKMDGGLIIANWTGNLLKLNRVNTIKGVVKIQGTTLLDLDFLNGLKDISCKDNAVCLTISDNPKLQSLGLKSLRKVSTSGSVAILIERNRALKLTESEVKALSVKAIPSKAVVRDAIVKKEENSNPTMIIVNSVVVVCIIVIIIIVVVVVYINRRKKKAALINEENKHEKEKSSKRRPTATDERKEETDVKSTEKANDSKKSKKSQHLSAETLTTSKSRPSPTSENQEETDVKSTEKSCTSKKSKKSQNISAESNKSSEMATDD